MSLDHCGYRGYAPFLLFVGLGRMLRGLLDWFSKDSWRHCLYYYQTNFSLCVKLDKIGDDEQRGMLVYILLASRISNAIKKYI